MNTSLHEEFFSAGFQEAPNSVPDNPDDWLERFNTFSIYEVLPQLIELWGLNVETQVESKKHRKTDRPMTTPLFLLRCKQLGLTLTELDMLTIGIINDMFTERENDDFDGWTEVAGQADFDAF